MIVYRPTDKILLHFGERGIYVSPLSHEMRMSVLADARLDKNDGGKVKPVNLSRKALKFGIRGLYNCDDIQFADGKKFELEFAEDGGLTDECLECLFQVFADTKLSIVGSGLATNRWDLIDDIPGVKGAGQAKKKLPGKPGTKPPSLQSSSSPSSPNANASN